MKPTNPVRPEPPETKIILTEPDPPDPDEERETEEPVIPDSEKDTFYNEEGELDND